MTDEGVKGGDNRLSAVSKRYDVDGKGYLDNVEQKMRKMDTAGKGHLDNSAIYSIFQELDNSQKKLLGNKRIVTGLIIFVLFQSAVMFGLVFLSVHLSKDFSPNGYGVLIGTNGKNIKLVGSGVGVGVEESNTTGEVSINDDGTVFKDMGSIPCAQVSQTAFCAENACSVSLNSFSSDGGFSSTTETHTLDLSSATVELDFGMDQVSVKGIKMTESSSSDEKEALYNFVCTDVVVSEVCDVSSGENTCSVEPWSCDASTECEVYSNVLYEGVDKLFIGTNNDLISLANIQKDLLELGESFDKDFDELELGSKFRLCV